MKSKIFSVEGSLSPIMNKNRGKLQMALENEINEWLESNNVQVLHVGFSSSMSGAGYDILSCIVFYNEN